MEACELLIIVTVLPFFNKHILPSMLLFKLMIPSNNAEIVSFHCAGIIDILGLWFKGENKINIDGSYICKSVLSPVFNSNFPLYIFIVPLGRSPPRSFHEEYLCYNCYFNFSPFIESSSIVTNRPNIYVWICIKIVRNKILRSKKARVCHK